MLATTLNTNEVKDAAGSEVEFVRKSTEGASLVYAKSGETYNAPYRLTISHSESGSGASLRRRSRIGFTKVVPGVSTDPRQCAAYVVTDTPVGDLAAQTEAKNVLANLMSFLATTGAGTTVLFDCTGSGADALINGTL